MFYMYSFDETLKELMKMEYLYNDGDMFVDYSWERALSIEGDVYSEWCLEFFSTMYLKCVWFRLCGREHVLTLLKFTVLLGLYEPILEETNRRTSLIWEPLMRVMHRLIVGALVHRLSSKERCQKRDLWMMSALEESRGINFTWIIAEHLCKHSSGLKENSLICRGHYVTKITKSLGYLVNEEVKKCSKSIKCEKLTTYMLASSMPNLGGTSIVPSSGYKVGGSSGEMHDEDDDDASMSEQRVHTDDDMGSEED
ncbi:hypothetical protein Tco_0343560 [Tanacetum coccineum]